MYERSAIEDWLARGNSTSPITNAQMGEKLTSAVQVRNVIEIVVRGKIVSGEKAAKRAQKIGDMDEVNGRWEPRVV